MSTLIFLQSLMSPFADGTSPGRLIFLVLFSIIVFGVSVTVARMRPELQKSLVARKRAFIVGMSAIGSIAGMTLAMQIAVFHFLQIPQFTNATFMTEDEITNTRLIHNHFGKVALGAFMPLAPESLERNGDTGSALVPVVPIWLALLTPLLVLVALGCFGVVHAATRDRSRAWSLVYLFLIFALIQNLLDGGVFAQNTLLAGALLSILVLVPTKMQLGYSVIAFALYALGAFAIWMGGLYGETFTYERSVGAGFVLLLTFVVLSQRMARGSGVILALLLVLAIALFAFYDSQSLRAYMNERVDPDISVLAAYPEEAEFAQSYEEVGRLRVYALQGEEGSTVEDIVWKARLPYWYYPVSVFSFETCRQGMERHATFTVLTKDVLSATPFNTERMFVRFEKEESSIPGWNMYTGLLVVNGCTPRIANVLHEAINEAGGTYSVLYALRSWGY